MAQTRSITDQAIDRDLPPYGRTDFVIANILTTAGLKQLDVYAALLARVTTWEFQFDGGNVANSNAFFSANTTLSSAPQISINYLTPPPIATEKVFSFGLEQYAIREDRNGSILTGASSTLTIPGEGYSDSFGELTTVYAGPKVDTLTTQIVSETVQTAAAQFDLEFVVVCSSGPGDTHTVFFKLSTSNVGHENGAGGTTVPVQVGNVTIEIPDWKAPGEFVTTFIPLYADSVGPEDVIWATSPTATYGSENVSGSVNITMRPVACWPYKNSQEVTTWNNDGTLAISIAQLYNGEP